MSPTALAGRPATLPRLLAGRHLPSISGILSPRPVLPVSRPLWIGLRSPASFPARPPEAPKRFCADVGRPSRP